MNKVKFSLKFKILLGICLLLITCVGMNLFYSYSLFVKDKTSYVYESGLKMAESISEKIQFSLDDLKTKTRFNYLFALSQENVTEKILADHPNAVGAGMGLFVDSVTSFEGAIFLKEVEPQKEEITQLLKRKIEASNKTSINLTFLSIVAERPFAFSIYKPEGSDKFFFMVVEMQGLFKKLTMNPLYLQKIVLMESKKSRQENAQWMDSLQAKVGGSGTSLVNFNEKEELVSYVYPNSSILVASMIDKEVAFAVTKLLIIRTFMFGTCLLGFAVLVGLVFAGTITNPISKLTQKTKEVADGHFDNDVVVSTSDELHLLGETFNWMGKEIGNLLKAKEDLISKLEDYNRNLEFKVAERTAELNSANEFMALMMDSLDQGLLVFNQDLVFSPIYSKASERIFNMNPNGKNLFEILKITKESDKSALSDWSSIVFSEKIPFDSAVRLAPSEKVFGNDFQDEDFKHIKLNYYPMRNHDDGSILNLLMVATDETKQVLSAQKVKENELRVQMILKVLNNKSLFYSFIHEAKVIFENLLLCSNPTTEVIDYSTAMMFFHTLKGGFGIFSIANLQKLAGDCESNVLKIKVENTPYKEGSAILLETIQKMKDAFVAFLSELDKIIGSKFSTNEVICEINKKVILSLRTILEQTKNKALINRFDDDFIKEPILNYFSAYNDLCTSIAVKLSKKFAGITFQGADLKIDGERFSELFTSLVHVFRNCMDHGLEDAETRLKSGKNPEGHLGVFFNIVDSPSSQNLMITIEDDGGGIDPQKIKERYKKLNMEAAVENLTDNELVYKIFDPFFSTKTEVNAYSGRGVGTSAVKEIVENKYKGTIEVESLVGKGTTFIITVPLSET